MAKKASFEEAIARLEKIVQRLEEGNVPLEESIKLYEEGMRLGKKCRTILEEADMRIHQLSARLEEEGGDE
jgi:exodeoxyribonuclease VII small subunit